MKKLLIQFLLQFVDKVKLFKIFWKVYYIWHFRYQIESLRKGIMSNNRNQNYQSNFRRNIHRIEKGLSMMKMKKSFALDYIEETVSKLKEGKENNFLDKNTIEWGEAVLKNYFEVVDLDDNLRKTKNLFYSNLPLSFNHENQKPYFESERAISDITYESFYSLAQKRRSVRYFLDKEVPITTIEKAIEIAKLSPSACNRQSFNFEYYSEPELVNKISKIPGGVSGYQLNQLFVVTANYSGYFNERDINAPIIDSSLASMSLIFALETLGVSSVCINWPNIANKEKEIRKLIKLPNYKIIVMLIGIGFPNPEGKIPFSGKVNTDKMLNLN